MSVALIGRALATPNLTGHQKLLLVTLSDAANEDGECWPGRVRLAERCCCSHRHIGRMLKELVAMGLLSITDRSRQTNFYVVFPDPVRTTAPDVLDADHDSIGHSAQSREDIGAPHTRASAIPEPSVEPSVSPALREDVDEVCAAFAEHVRDQTGRRPAASGRWRTDVRLLLDTDLKYQPDPLAETLRIVEWLRGPGGGRFWAAVILSPKKLRKHFPALRAEAARSNGSAPTGFVDHVARARDLADRLEAQGR